LDNELAQCLKTQLVFKFGPGEKEDLKGFKLRKTSSSWIPGIKMQFNRTRGYG